MLLSRKLTIILASVAAVAALAALASRGGPPGIQALAPHRGAIRESFREPGKTRLENTWRITMPVAGRIGRINLEPGDRVQKGQVLAEFDALPLEAAIAEAQATIDRFKATLIVMDDNSLEQNSLTEAQENVSSSEQSVAGAQERINSAKRRVDYTQKELKRIENLARDKTVSQSQLDDAKFNADTAELELRRAESDAAAERARSRAMKASPERFRRIMDREKLERKEIVAQIAQAEAALDRAKHDRELANLASPIDGVVLERYERGERTLTPGTELLLLGDPAQIEVIADILTQDALRLAIGGEADLEAESGGLNLKGKVRRVEPQGFTKLSSLGVEQQRVNVIATVENPPPNLGVGFRLYARFYTGVKSDALLVPRFSVMQAPDQSFYVFKIAGGKLKRQAVKIGLRSDLEMEIAEGLQEKDRVVASPDSTMQDGQAAKAVAAK